MAHLIRAIAPTVYQYQSVSFFGPPEKKWDGSYVFEKRFQSEEEAKDYLKERVSYYAQSDGTEEEIAEMYAQCDEGYLEYDAVTARIVETDDFEEA